MSDKRSKPSVTNNEKEAFHSVPDMNHDLQIRPKLSRSPDQAAVRVSRNEVSIC